MGVRTTLDGVWEQSQQLLLSKINLESVEIFVMKVQSCQALNHAPSAIQYEPPLHKTVRGSNEQSFFDMDLTLHSSHYTNCLNWGVTYNDSENTGVATKITTIYFLTPLQNPLLSLRLKAVENSLWA